MQKSRAEWCALLDMTDCCAVPVLSMAEAPEHPHNKARSAFVEIAGVMQPAPAPRFSATPSAQPRPPAVSGADSADILASLGYDESEIAGMLSAAAFDPH